MSDTSTSTSTDSTVSPSASRGTPGCACACWRCPASPRADPASSRATEYEGMVLFVGERTVSHPSWITPPSSLDGLFVPVHYVTL